MTPTLGAPPLWTDEQILEALALMDVDGLSASEAGRRLRTTKNAILGMRFRVRASFVQWPDETGDGTMPPRWWQREVAA